jgi:hypothetical protein
MYKCEESKDVAIFFDVAIPQVREVSEVKTKISECSSKAIFGVNFADRKSRAEIEKDAGVGDRQLSNSLHSLAEFRVSSFWGSL